MNKEFLKKFYRSYKLYIFSLVTVLSSLILIVFAIYPQVNKLLSNKQVQEEVYKKSKFLEAKALVLESYDTEDLNIKLRNVLNSYPVDKDLLSAVSLLQNLVSESGFSIIGLSIGSGLGKEANAQSYSIKLDLLGPVTALPIILSKIENSSRLMRVSSLETVIGADLAATAISLQVNILYSSAPGGFGTIDSPIPELSQRDEEVLAKLARVSEVTSQFPGPSVSPSSSQLGPRGKENPFE